MRIKEQLKKLRESLVYDKNTEFNAEFVNHPIGDGNIYRLYYVDYRRAGESYGMNSHVSMTNWPCKAFMLPNGMSREDGFKVLSYLTDFIEKRQDITPCSLKSVRTLDGVLDLERFGFSRVQNINEDEIINLFTIAGRIAFFKKSKLYNKYFEWYTEGISLEEIENIYRNINMEFKDIVWLDEQVKTLKR